MIQYATEATIDGGRVLDLGTKDAHKTAALDAEVVGVDVDIQGDAGEGVAFVQADGATLPFAANTFDAVIADQLFEHVEHKMAIVEEMARVLRPDGVAYVAFPHRWLPTKPHGLPRWFSLLPREIRCALASRWWPGENLETYVHEHTWPLGPGRARRLFETQFGDVRHATLPWRRAYADRYVDEGDAAARLFETVRPLVERVAATDVGRRAFELTWPHPEFELRSPKVDGGTK